MDDQQFRLLLDRFGRSWTGYRKVRRGVMKRLRRRMVELDLSCAEAYLRVMEDDPALRIECERLLTVSISRFFRDKKVWEILQNRILPALFKEQREPVRVWSAGCASGEEAYSFRIAWESVMESSGAAPELEIVATDLNPVYLERAKAGIYARSSLREVPAEVVDRCFEHQGGEDRYGGEDCYTIRARFRSYIKWKELGFHEAPPGTGFQVIFLRNNLLTYYRDPFREQALHRAVDRLATSGYLIIGSHERLPRGEWNLNPVESVSCVFRKGWGNPK